MARVKVNSFRDLIIGKPYHISIPSGTSLNCSNEYISFSSVSNIVTSITPVDDTTGGTTGYFGTAWASNMFYYNNKRYNFGQTSTASFECDVVISSLAFSNKYPMYADNLAQFFYIEEQKTLVPYLTSIANGYRTSSGSSSLINPQLFPLMMQHYTKPVSLISNTGDSEMTVISTVGGPTTSDLYLKPSVGYEGFWSTERVLKILKPTQMTFPSSTSSSSSGTLAVTVTPSSSVQYVNVPTGYLSSSKYIKINAQSTSAGAFSSNITTTTNSIFIPLVTTSGTLSATNLQKVNVPSGKLVQVSLNGSTTFANISDTAITIIGNVGSKESPTVNFGEAAGTGYASVGSYTTLNLVGTGSSSKAINLSGELGQLHIESGATCSAYFTNEGTIGGDNTNSLNTGTIGKSAYPIANTGTIYLGQNGTTASGSVYYKNNGGSNILLVQSGKSRVLTTSTTPYVYPYAYSTSTTSYTKYTKTLSNTLVVNGTTYYIVGYWSTNLGTPMASDGTSITGHLIPLGDNYIRYSTASSSSSITSASNTFYLYYNGSYLYILCYSSSVSSLFYTSNGNALLVSTPIIFGCSSTSTPTWTSGSMTSSSSTKIYRPVFNYGSTTSNSNVDRRFYMTSTSNYSYYYILNYISMYAGSDASITATMSRASLTKNW